MRVRQREVLAARWVIGQAKCGGHDPCRAAVDAGWRVDAGELHRDSSDIGRRDLCRQGGQLPFTGGTLPPPPAPSCAGSALKPSCEDVWTKASAVASLEEAFMFPCMQIRWHSVS